MSIAEQKKKYREPAGRTEPSRASFWPAMVQDFGLGSVLHYLGPSRVRAEPALYQAEPKARDRCPALAATFLLLFCCSQAIAPSIRFFFGWPYSSIGVGSSSCG
jgi:hypothetical protein